MSEPLVLIPGLQSDISSWLPLIKRLGHHFALTVPRGQQFSPDINAMAKHVIEQSPNRFHLVGWSMGGYIAFEMLRQAPEKLASLTLIATTAAPESLDSRERRRLALDLARDEGLRGYQTANLQKCLFAPEEFERESFEHLLKASETLGLSALETQISAIMDRPDSLPDLTSCNCPVLIIAGRNDNIIPIEHSRNMHAALPASTFHEIADCGHCPPMEKPDYVSKLLVDWLSSDLFEHSPDRISSNI